MTLADIREHGVNGDLQPMTREVLDTFRALAPTRATAPGRITPHGSPCGR